MQEKLSIYLDNAATTQVRDEVIDLMTRTMSGGYGNPSSSHAHGRRAALLLERARNNIAEALEAKPKYICFTSGGTEANNLAISGVARDRNLTRNGRHIITSAAEHNSILKPIGKLEDEGFEITYIKPCSAGRITAEAFKAALREDTIFASVMLVNNETGAVNPISEYAAQIRRRNLSTILHTDAVQGFCKIPFTAKTLGADLISISSHKLHGPRGAGALYASEKVKLSPLILGGAQEGGKRAGTEALPAIAGFGEAARLGHAELEHTGRAVRAIREYTADLLKIKIPEAIIIGKGDSPFILCISLPGYKSEVLLNYLDGEGISVSKGSACKKGARSRTLETMGLANDIIDGALRVSFSRLSSRDEAETFVQALAKAAKTLAH